MNPWDWAREYINSFCEEKKINPHLSQDMPRGYETAFGSYDVTCNTLFLNLSLLQQAEKYEALFYLYHELRHAEQYLHPERFGPEIQQSRQYVILYNGTCFKLVGGAWRQCVLQGDEAYFTDAYKSLPHELDANDVAFRKVADAVGVSPQLKKLYSFWAPKIRWKYQEYEKLFVRIDEALEGKVQDPFSLSKIF